MNKSRGAMTILTIFTGLIAIGAFAAMGLGQMMWQKQELQRIADMAATTAASQLGNGPTFTEAYQVATQNGSKTGEVVLKCTNGVSSAAVDCATASTARAEVTRTVTPFFFAGSRSILAVAEAQPTPSISGNIRSTVATVSTSQSALLNGLLNAIGGSGTNLNLTAASFDGLLNAGLNLKLLDLQTQLGAASLQTLLTTNVKLGDFLNAAVQVASGGDKTTAVATVGSIRAALNSITLPVGNLITTNIAQSDAAKATVSLGDLALTTILAGSNGRAANVNLTSGALGIAAKVYVIEAPQLFIGKKIPGTSPIAYGKTAQIKISMDISQGVTLPSLGLSGVTSVSISVLQMSLYLQAGGGDVTVNDISCKIPRSNDVTALSAHSSLATVCLTSAPNNFADNNTVPIVCGGAANVATVTASILGVPISIGVKLGTSASAPANTASINHVGTAVYTEHVTFSAAQGLSNLVSGLTINPQLTLPVVSFLLQPTLNLLATALVPALTTTITPVVAAAGAILDDVSRLLGISLNDVYITANSLDCSTTRLIR